MPRSSQDCRDDGQWHLFLACNTPTQICRANGTISATCETNSPYEIGNTTFNAADSWVPFNSENYWNYFIPISITRNVRVVNFRVRAPGSGVVEQVTYPNDGSCRMAVYNDNSGKPGTTVATSANNISLSNSAMTFVSGSTTAVAAVLQAGRTYWLGGECFLDQTVAPNKRAFTYTRGAGSAYRFFNMANAGTFPANPSGSMQTGVTYSWILEVRDEP